MPLKRLVAVLYWVFPSLFCVVLYWVGLRTWFHDDDFAFLGLYPDIHNARELALAIFVPTVHGTWRPLSERVYFIGVQWLFGVPHAVPFRVIAFLCQIANLVLMSALALRLTRSRVAGLVAPILWIANSALVTVMVWNCALMYVLCVLVLQSGLWFLLRYIESDQPRYYAAMWAVFLVGFLVIETNIVFPMLAAAYTWLCARRYFRKTLPLFIPSILFVVAHERFIPKQMSGPYAPRFNLEMLRTLGSYWYIALHPLVPAIFPKFPQRAAELGVAVFSILLIGFAACQAYRRNLVPLFFLAWFVIVLGPVLPLPEHVTDYYLTLPLVGLALLAANAAGAAFRYRAWTGLLASALLVFYLAETIPSAQGAAKWNKNRSDTIKHLILSGAKLSRQNPDKLILLDNIDSDLYWASVGQDAFRFLRVENIFLTPGSQACLSGLGPPNDRFFASLEQMYSAMRANRLLVYGFERGRLEDITDAYPSYVSDTLDVAEPGKADQLGPGWQPAEHQFRWMMKTASVKLHGPVNGCHRLYVSGECAAAQLARGPFQMSVRLNNFAFPAVTIKTAGPFTFDFPFQASPEGRYDVVLEVDHTVTSPPDTRPLGLAFGTFKIE